MLKEGADPHIKTKQGESALHLAVQGNQPLVIAVFLQLGLDINEQDRQE